jgi:sugar/nucleoside kinase (ribokinase family)
MRLADAVRFANAAAAIAVTRDGAQTAAPYRAEILQLLGDGEAQSLSPDPLRGA